MMRRIVFGFIVFIVATVGMGAVSSSSMVYASASGSEACSSLDVINSTQGCGNGTSSTPGKTTVDSMIKKVVSALSFVVGIITVFMVILAGFQFITSGGDSNAVSKARTALFYAMIGLLVVALSQFLVHFVLNGINA